jgi:hypothetical protein
MRFDRCGIDGIDGIELKKDTMNRIKYSSTSRLLSLSIGLSCFIQLVK